MPGRKPGRGTACILRLILPGKQQEKLAAETRHTCRRIFRFPVSLFRSNAKKKRSLRLRLLFAGNITSRP